MKYAVVDAKSTTRCRFPLLPKSRAFYETFHKPKWHHVQKSLLLKSNLLMMHKINGDKAQTLTGPAQSSGGLMLRSGVRCPGKDLGGSPLTALGVRRLYNGSLRPKRWMLFTFCLLSSKRKSSKFLLVSKNRCYCRSSIKTKWCNMDFWKYPYLKECKIMKGRKLELFHIWDF